MIVTRELIRAFAEATGDDAPIHADAEFARQGGFAAPIAQGLLLATIAEWNLAAEGRSDAASDFEVRFERPVETGQELGWHVPEEGQGAGFELRARGEPGEPVVARGRSGGGSEPVDGAGPAPRPAPSTADAPATWYAEDVMERFEAAEVELPTPDSAAEARLRALLQQVRPLDAPAPRGALLFARGFACFLARLLECPLPATGSAGHLGDRWRLHAIPGPSARVRVRFAPSQLERSRSRPEMAIVTFSIQLESEQQRLLDGEATIMIPARESAAG